jgi:hypothetical protein
MQTIYENKLFGQKVELIQKNGYVIIKGNWNNGAKFVDIKEARAMLRDYGFKASK